jgi:neutral ceramidase
MMTQLLEIGCAKVDITPTIGHPLSGYGIRQNKPSEYIDSNIFVYAFVVKQDKLINFLFSYDLLAIGTSLEEQLYNSLTCGLGSDFNKSRCVFVTTHNHSAPPTCPLEGESDPDPQYLQYLCDQTLKGALQALSSSKPGTMFYTSIQIPGLTYNRRALLTDGRVSMTLLPEIPVLERGPVDPTFSVLVWRDQQGNNIAVFVHFGCHAAAMATQGISGDIPGEISRLMSELYDAPCIFLQSATGDVNALAISANRPTMMAWIDQFWGYVKKNLGTPMQVLSVPFYSVSTSLPLVYQPLPPRNEVERKIIQLDRIAHGDLDSPDLQNTMILLADVMNFKPGEHPDPNSAIFCAQCLVKAEQRVLIAIDSGRTLSPCPLQIKLWNIGQIVFVFIAAEVFTITGLKIRALGKNQAILPVTYSSPIVGYLPDRESMQKGGYEVADAWRFYRQPAPFDMDSEKRVVEFIESLLHHLQHNP